MLITAKVVTAAMTLGSVAAGEARHCSGSIRPAALVTMTAPRAAAGRYWMGSVSSSRTTQMERRRPAR